MTTDARGLLLPAIQAQSLIVGAESL